MVDGALVAETQADLDEIAANSSSAQLLAAAKRKRLAQLRNGLMNRADLVSLIFGGTASPTGPQYAAFMAAVVTNARSLISQINAAPDLAALNAINLNSGWPSNP